MSSLNRQEALETFRRQHRLEQLTLLFTDLVDSTQLKQRWGEREAAAAMQRHNGVLRSTLAGISGGIEIETAGDSFFLAFARPADAVQFALRAQRGIRELASLLGPDLAIRIGIHAGSVFVAETPDSVRPMSIFGLAIDTCARVMSLACGGQCLTTRGVFDEARVALTAGDLAEHGVVSWLNHGAFALKGIEEPLEICEVGQVGFAPLERPAGTDKVQRAVTPEAEPVLGWRPARGIVVPGTAWAIEDKLGAGGFGEVWLARHNTAGVSRVLKFCFKAAHARSLRREITLFQLLKERIGQHPHIVHAEEVNLDVPPFYLVMEFAAGRDLRSWAAARGGVRTVTMEFRLELIAQTADALQAAHEVGIIHRDVKPGNILIVEDGTGRPAAKLTDFGIARMASEELLAGTVGAGFTQTMAMAAGDHAAGTHLYIAPECLAGAAATTRADIYSLGVVLFQVVIGDFSRPLTSDWQRAVDDPLVQEDIALCVAGEPGNRFAAVSQLAVQLRTRDQRRRAREEAHERAAAIARQAYRKGVTRAAALAALVIAAVAGLGLLARFQSVRAQRLAEDLRQNLYAADINLASRSLNEENFGRALSLLDKHVPAAGEPDLRGFEWRYLRERSLGSQIECWLGHHDGVSCIAFSPDGRRVLSSGYDRTVVVWDYARRQPVRTLGPIHEAVNLHGLDSVRVGGRTVVAAASWLSPFLVWDIDTGEELARLEGSAPVTFTPDGSAVAARAPGGIRFYDTATWRERAFLRTPLIPSVLKFSRDGRTLVMAAASRLHLFSYPELQPLPALEPAPREPMAIAFSADDRYLALGSRVGDCEVWDWAARRRLHHVTAARSGVMEVAFSPDATRLATVAEYHVKVWSVPSGALLATHLGHENEMGDVTFDPTGTTVLSTSKDRSIRLWTDRVWLADQVVGDAGRPLGFTADSRLVRVVRSKQDGRVGWRVAATGEPAPEGSEAAIGPWQLVAASPQGGQLAIARPDGTTEVWAEATASVIARLPADGPECRSLIYSPDGSLLAVVTAVLREPAVVRVYETTTWRQILTVPNGNVQVGELVAFHSKLPRLAVSLASREIEMWDWREARKLGVFQSRDRGVWWSVSLAFSHDGALFASGSFDGTLRLWDAHALREVAVLLGHRSGIHTVAFTPDDRTVITAGGDRTVRLWNIASRQEMVQWGPLADSLGHVVLSGDGRYIAAGVPVQRAIDGHTWLWRAPSMAEISEKERQRVRSFASPLTASTSSKSKASP